MKYLVPIILLLLIIAHQDYWFFSRADLLFDFLPFSLGYHMALSVVTAVAWIVIVQCCWPADVEDFETQSESGRDDLAAREGVSP